MSARGYHSNLSSQLKKKRIKLMLIDDPNNLFYYNVDPNTAVNMMISNDPNNSFYAFLDGLQSTFFKSITLRFLGTILGK